MRYYFSGMAEQLKATTTNELLQKYFPSSKWGACVYFNYDKSIDVIEICKLTDETLSRTVWEHYAQIQHMGDGRWEVNSKFNGKNEDELWIFGYYTRLSDAIRRIASSKFRKLKPIKIY